VRGRATACESLHSPALGSYHNTIRRTFCLCRAWIHCGAIPRQEPPPTPYSSISFYILPARCISRLMKASLELIGHGEEAKIGGCML